MNDDPLLPASRQTANEPQRPERIVYPEHPRFRRIRFLSKLMDQSIVLPTGYRIGLDPLLGLLPAFGDALGSLVSCYLVYEAARLGVPKRILARMLGNVLVEALAGMIPVAGDIFDAVWKANMRNLRMLELHYHPTMRERSLGRLAGWIGMVLLMVLFANVAFALLVIKLIQSLFSWMFS